jgi:hypothetical protein
VLRYLRSLFAIVLFGLAAGETSHAINIVLEYPAGELFGATLDTTAKNAINAAAADISAAITSSLNAINTDVYVGQNGNPPTTATFDMKFSISNPSGSGQVEVLSATAPGNTVTMRVGAKSLSGSTLGVGGPNGLGFNVALSGFPSQFVGAVADVEPDIENAYKRGGGPIIGTLAGNLNWEGNVANYSIDYGISFGSLSFDKDTPDEILLSNYWHFNHLTPVAAGKNDLYSVALHEMLHAIGIGTSSSWTSRVSSGVNWTGPEVAALYGSGTGLVSSGHITEGILSTRISDGTPQEVVMDPNITTGNRKSLTALDLAFLRDIGYSTIIPNPIFSPADFDHDGFVDDDDLLTWRNAYGSNANGDTDDDNDTDGRDFLVWQREFTGSGPLSAGYAVPEPGLATMALTALLCFSCSRRR